MRAAGCVSGSGNNSTTAGAADPMITTLVFGCVARTLLSANSPARSLDASALGVLLRAESAANGDAEFDRADVSASGRRISACDAMFLTIPGRVAGREAAASLSNCSIGN